MKEQAKALQGEFVREENPEQGPELARVKRNMKDLRSA